MHALISRGDGPSPRRPQESHSQKCAVPARTAHFAVVSVSGGHSVQFLCSRLPAHREFCWPLPGDSGLAADLGRFADGLDAFAPLSSGGLPRTAVGDRPIGLQMSRIIGSWAAGWRFDRLQLQGGMLPDDANREPSFSFYQVDTDSESHWFLGNGTFLNSLWMLTSENLAELKGLFKAWKSPGR
jgi:hypothetical protein